MPLESLVLSRDHSVIGMLRQGLAEFGAVVEVVTGSHQAAAELERRGFDAILIDCDDVHGALGALKAVRSSPHNGSAKLFAIINGITTDEQARQMGATSTIRKPLSPEKIAQALRDSLEHHH